LFGSAVLCFALVSACSQSTEPEQELADGLSLVSGNNQTAAPGAILPLSPTVQVAQDGEPVQGQSVSWTVTAGGGTVNATETTTDNAGRTSTTWTLGPNEGNNRVEASVPGMVGSPVQFSATGFVQPPAPSVVSVTVEDFAFDPSSARLAAGGSVTWTFSGGVAHNVTFNSGSSSPTQGSGTFSRTFSATGSFSYRCTIHAEMSGTINVE
jgi:plastocyanin